MMKYRGPVPVQNGGDGPRMIAPDGELVTDELPDLDPLSQSSPCVELLQRHAILLADFVGDILRPLGCQGGPPLDGGHDARSFSLARIHSTQSRATGVPSGR